MCATPWNGQQVVHAERVERDRPRDDQLVVAVVVGERRRPERLRRQQLGVGVGDPARRVLQRLGVDVGAERAQQARGPRAARRRDRSRAARRGSGMALPARGRPRFDVSLSCSVSVAGARSLTGSTLHQHGGKHPLGQFHEPVRVAPLVVVPGDDFDLGAVHDRGQRRVEDRGEGRLDDVGRDDRLFAVGEDAGERAACCAFGERGVDLGKASWRARPPP